MTNDYVRSGTAILLILFVTAGCDRNGSGPRAAEPSPRTAGEREKAVSLADARRGFQTRLVRKDAEHEAAPEPPAGLLRLVRYDSPAGKLAAYLSPPPGDGNRHPAILWVFGGFGNGIGETAWEPAPPDNDQSASAFRKAGIVMMYPSFRGGNDNPGFKEGFFGEVDDLLAAADYLAARDGVDPNRIYLGGHSTGGTLALLAAETTDRFRAVFCFGPVDDVAGYGADSLPFDTSDSREVNLRAPGRWTRDVRSPTFVFEGTGRGNLRSVLAMKRATSNPAVHFYAVRGASHFSILAPVTKVVAEKINQDTGPAPDIRFDEAQLSGLFAK